MARKDQSNLDAESVASQWHLLRCCVKEIFHHLGFSDLYIRYNQTGPVLLERWRNRLVRCPDLRSFQLSRVGGCSFRPYAFAWVIFGHSVYVIDIE